MRKKKSSKTKFMGLYIFFKKRGVLKKQRCNLIVIFNVWLTIIKSVKKKKKQWLNIMLEERCDWILYCVLMWKSLSMNRLHVLRFLKDHHFGRKDQTTEASCWELRWWNITESNRIIKHDLSFHFDLNPETIYRSHFKDYS